MVRPRSLRIPIFGETWIACRGWHTRLRSWYSATALIAQCPLDSAGHAVWSAPPASEWTARHAVRRRQSKRGRDDMIEGRVGGDALSAGGARAQRNREQRRAGGLRGRYE